MISRPPAWDLVILALKVCIDTHGPISKKYISSAAQRICSALVIEDIRKESPRIARFLIRMIKIKYPEDISLLERQDENRINVQIARADEAVKKCADERKRFVAALVKALNGQASKEEVLEELNGKDYEELHQKYQILYEKYQKVPVRAENKKKYQTMLRRNAQMKQQVEAMKKDMEDMRRWQDDGGQ